MPKESYPYSFKGHIIYRYGVKWIDVFEKIHDLHLDNHELYCYFTDMDDDYSIFGVQEGI